MIEPPTYLDSKGAAVFRTLMRNLQLAGDDDPTYQYGVTLIAYAIQRQADDAVLVQLCDEYRLTIRSRDVRR